MLQINATFLAVLLLLLVQTTMNMLKKPTIAMQYAAVVGEMKCIQMQLKDDMTKSPIKNNP